MNNQLTAANLAGYGRGPDTTLVHMAPQEVAGLQALAMAHGGSLTINPETGLPEAGFLSSILPAVAGFALGPGGLGLMGSLGAAATVGGISALTSGSLSKGLMAGLGAYGGSELGGGLESLGAQGAAQAAATMADAGASGPLTGSAFSNSAPAALSGWDATKAGFSKAISDPKALIGQLGGNMGALKTAGMAVAPMIADQGVQTVTKAPETPQYYRPMILDRQQTGGVRTPGAPATSEKKWFDDVWTNPQPVKVMAAGGAAAEDDPYYRLSGQSEDAYRYLMGLAPRSRGPVTVTPPPPTGGGNFVMPRKPEPVVTPGAGGTDGGRGNDSIGGDYAGSGTGFPGSGVDQYGVSTPTTGVASYANQIAAVLGNLGLRSLSDAIAKNIDPNYGHEGMSGRPGGRTGPNLTGDLPTLNVDTGEESYDTTPDASGETLDSILGGNAITGGVTPAGAGVAANPMGTDPAQSAAAVANAANANMAPAANPMSADPAQRGQNAIDVADQAQQDIADRSGMPIGTGPTSGLPSLADAVTATIGGYHGKSGDPDADVGPSVLAASSPAVAASAMPAVAPSASFAPAVTQAAGLSSLAAAAQAEAQARAEAQAQAEATATANAAQAQAEASDRDAGDTGGFDGGGGGGGNDSDGGGGFGPQAEGGVVGRFASGGLGSLGGYSDGGRLLRGPGDGVSDSIPATIGRSRQPARLADGEFVFPARIVSELGNGSTEAGARKLYAMMNRIQANRRKSMGKTKVAVDSKSERLLRA